MMEAHQSYFMSSNRAAVRATFGPLLARLTVAEMILKSLVWCLLSIISFGFLPSMKPDGQKSLWNLEKLFYAKHHSVGVFIILNFEIMENHLILTHIMH